MKAPPSTSRPLHAVVAGLAMLGLGFGLSATGTLSIPSVFRSPPTIPSASDTAGWTDDDTNPQLLMVAYLKSTCAWCNRPETLQAVDEATVLLRRLADQRGVRFVRIGVGLDRNPAAGGEYLKKFGEFDELFLGGGWQNAGAISLFASQMPPVASTPTVAVFHRRLTRAGDAWSSITQVDRLELGALLVGARELIRWVENGAPVRGDLATIGRDSTP